MVSSLTSGRSSGLSLTSVGIGFESRIGLFGVEVDVRIGLRCGSAALTRDTKDRPFLSDTDGRLPVPTRIRLTLGQYGC